MGLDFAYIPGQTPLEEEEKEGLLIPTITTRGELDEYEQQNIEEAIQWLFTRKLNPENILTERFVLNLHKRMYGNVWSWAGRIRNTNKNLGIDKLQIPTALRILLDDTLFWIKNETFSPDEIAIRFKHRMVSIHCFSNGKGRHSRLMADVIMEKIYKQAVFSWGAGDLSAHYDVRTEYLRSMKDADQGNIRPLLTFSRS